MEAQRLNYLLHRYLQKTATASEREELFALVRSSEQGVLEKAAARVDLSAIPSMPLPQDVSDEILNAILLVRKDSSDFMSQDNSNIHRPIHRVHFLRRGFFRYAAAVLVTVGLATLFYLWTTNRNHDDLATTSENKRLPTDIGPGGEKAILTLADGAKIVLDSAANGSLANQGGVRIVKLANGQITYDLQRLASEEVVFNTMSTPKGGQYQVTLPDGTKTWLNASSSITFPTAFTGNHREVKIQGEIYFEVAKNKQQPFIVNVDEKSTVEVLGTHFNVNSYPDEGQIKTTLIEGIVKVTNDQESIGTDDSTYHSVLLKPGQQAVISIQGQAGITHPDAESIKVQPANIEQIVAWKNGIFDFDGADLKTVMRQLERWYDIKVQYKDSISDMTFEGKMYRNVSLLDVLEVLRKMGVRFQLEGKTLMVL